MEKHSEVGGLVPERPAVPDVTHHLRAQAMVSGLDSGSHLQGGATPQSVVPVEDSEDDRREQAPAPASSLN